MSKNSFAVILMLYRTCWLDLQVRYKVLYIIHTLRVHNAHAAANLNSGYSKYAKVARVHYFCTTQEKSDFQAQYWPNVGPVQAARLGIG